MKRFISTMKRGGGGRDEQGSNSVLPQGDSPDALIVREVTAFCESGGPNNQSAGDEYLHLPAIVDAAESSPVAAKEAANCIRRFISKENSHRAYAQYNAIMLTRILNDNPAESFTRNFDSKFILTVKELLRDGRDMSVQQILRETLDYFESEKLSGNDSLGPLIEMWKKEKAKATSKVYGNVGPRTLNAPAWGQSQPQNYYSRPHHHRPKGLPPPDELAARIEEAKTTARLLLQTIQSTPTSDLLNNDLIKEFADRASSANRSIQSYIHSDNPTPDEDTMLTLIETNEQLSIAMSKHQRALLQARKAMGAGSTSPPPQPGQNMYPTPATPPRHGAESYLPPPGPPPGAKGAMRSQNPPYSPPPPIPARSRPISNNLPAPTQALNYGVAENPFADEAPQEEEAPKHRSYDLYDRPSTTTPPPPQEANLQQSPQPASAYSQDASSPRAPYNPGYHSTPSYMLRQESATNHLTMHGASPTPPEPVQEEMGRSPISPANQDANGVQRRMENLSV